MQKLACFIVLLRLEYTFCVCGIEAVRPERGYGVNFRLLYKNWGTLDPCNQAP